MIVVTAPTGQIGRHVVRHLVEGNAAVRVIARDPARIAPEIRDRVEIVTGSHGAGRVVDQALEGASALFWLAPGDPSGTPEAAYADFARPAADAVRRYGVGRVVSITALGRGTRWQNASGLVTASLRMDDLLMETGAAFRGIAMPSFMDNTLHSLTTIRDQGIMLGTYEPDTKAPKTAARDAGATAARLLADQSWTGGQDVPLLGPEDLSMNDMAAIVADVLGREIRYQQLPYAAFKQRVIGQGGSEAFADAYIEMFKAKDEGVDVAVRREAAERAPTTFRQWCLDELRPAVEGLNAAARSE